MRSITDGFIAVDNDFLVCDWNEAAEETFNLPASDAIGKKLTILAVDNNDPSLQAFYLQLQKAFEERITINAENYLTFRNKWFDVRIHPHKTGLFIYFKDVTDRKSQELLLEKLLKQEINKQKMVARAVVDAQEKERAEIGKELHDNVNQILSTAKLFLEVAKNNPEERISLLDKSSQNILLAINEIRNISRSLVPPSISDLGLIASINDLAENIALTKTLKIHFYTNGDIESRLNGNQKLMLFRIIQEQVNNVLKHANATHVSVALREEDDFIELIIADNGKGFDLEKARLNKGVGLSNIISRAEMFNGKVDIRTATGSGCTLNVNIPL